MYHAHLKTWMDDVSGNESKQYNAHLNMYFQHANLPKDMLDQEFFVRFLATSPHASTAELSRAMVEDIRYAINSTYWCLILNERRSVTGTEWFEAYHCIFHEPILFRVIPHNDPADNPQQSVMCSHIGLKGLFWCRKCMVGGTAEERESNEGYQRLYKV
jgi:hypothetical protein